MLLIKPALSLVKVFEASSLQKDVKLDHSLSNGFFFTNRLQD